MTKLEFLSLLYDKLSHLPHDDVEERLNFYSGMIADRMEEGLSEQEAVLAIGNIDKIAAQVEADIPHIPNKADEPKAKRRLGVWEIVLLVLGCPLWIPLLIAVFAVIISLYVSLWSVIISLWAAFASVLTSAFAGALLGIVFAIGSNPHTGIALIGAGFVLAGLSIFLFLGCKAATKGTVLLTKKALLAIKNRFVKKEAA